MGLSDGIDWIKDKVSEGFEEFIGLFSGMFSNLNEFSIPGLVGGFLCAFLIFIVRGKVLEPFLKRMPAGQEVITMIICYIAAFVVGYLMLKKAFSE